MIEGRLSPNSTCNTSALTGAMPAEWDWVKLATFKGSRPHGSLIIDHWSYTVSGLSNSVFSLFFC